MRVARKTSTMLVVKTGERRWLLVTGLILLGISVWLVAFINYSPLSPEEFRTPSLFAYLQHGNPALEGDVAGETTAKTSFRLARYVGYLLLVRERLWLTLATVGLISAVVMLVSPHRGSTITFDQPRQQVEIKEAGWFFQTHSEHYPFENVTEVRVERDRLKRKDNKSYGVNLIISHSEGTPLSKNYVYYKTVFPLSESFRYDYATAQQLAEQVKTFMAAAETA